MISKKKCTHEEKRPVPRGYADLNRQKNAEIDKELLALLKTGNQAAFEQIYLRWHKPVRSLMLKITRSAEDAEDIAQDVFTHLWNDRERIARYNKISSLVFLLATRRAVDLMRRYGFHGTYVNNLNSDPALDISPDLLVEAEETKLLTEIAIGRMPDKQREVFLLHLHEELSPREIADRLGISYESARKHIYNSKKYIEGLLHFIAVVFIHCE